ncbi:hypothetical protein SAMN05421720_1201 [Rhodospira trueperi]|uniref:Uncharacterized protein n=1 Tax=Rhodospira trueperi TaxID=69960 RepID=A0A1G7HDX9_9PROT|nr:hypothetical protein SAMN05421720_1201 [Rhodospira trueperi]
MVSYALDCFTLVLRRGFAMTSQDAARAKSRRFGGKKCEYHNPEGAGEQAGTGRNRFSPSILRSLPRALAIFSDPYYHSRNDQTVALVRSETRARGSTAMPVRRSGEA